MKYTWIDLACLGVVIFCGICIYLHFEGVNSYYLSLIS